jgi:hypothetical protein
MAKDDCLPSSRCGFDSRHPLFAPLAQRKSYSLLRRRSGFRNSHGAPGWPGPDREEFAGGVWEQGRLCRTASSAGHPHFGRVAELAYAAGSNPASAAGSIPASPTRVAHLGVRKVRLVRGGSCRDPEMLPDDKAVLRILVRPPLWGEQRPLAEGEKRALPAMPFRSTGRTPDSGSGNRGSNPREAAEEDRGFESRPGGSRVAQRIEQPQAEDAGSNPVLAVVR